MAKEPRAHYLVEFASRYAGSRFKTLTAGAALWRAEALTDDAEALLELQKAGEAKDVSFGNRGGTYEIISYFAVGFVTCLEWHARSRLVDLLLFQPTRIEAGDLKNVATLAISQMVAEGVTVPHLLGAATNVSRLTEYLKVFRRIFEALNIQTNLEGELRKEKTEVDLHQIDVDNNLFAVINDLFEGRNYLVHEIDKGIIGHFSLRNLWSPKDAVAYGKAVISCIKLIEAFITDRAPRDFPNRLRADGGEEDEYEKLSAKIRELEAELTAKIDNLHDSSSSWAAALDASKSAREKELEYLGKSDVLRPVRHLDFRRSFQIELLKTRVAFLLLLKSEFG